VYQDDLVKLSKEELIALTLAQTAKIEELTRRIADLEAKLDGPPKTPDNSSLPPSQGRKPKRAERRAAKKRKGRPGVFRALAPNPDRIVASVAERCPHCDLALSLADQSGFHAYDHIELPPIRPVITRIHRQPRVGSANPLAQKREDGRGTDGSQTRRWRKPDSNPRSRLQKRAEHRLVIRQSR
jgi:hypothetical protein